MDNAISIEELRELENCISPLEDRMDKVIRDYILASRSYAAVKPRCDWGADDVFEDTFDMECVIELLQCIKQLIKNHGGLPRFARE